MARPESTIYASVSSVGTIEARIAVRVSTRGRYFLRVLSGSYARWYTRQLGPGDTLYVSDLGPAGEGQPGLVELTPAVEARDAAVRADFAAAAQVEAELDAIGKAVPSRRAPSSDPARRLDQARALAPLLAAAQALLRDVYAALDRREGDPLGDLAPPSCTKQIKRAHAGHRPRRWRGHPRVGG